MKSFPEMIEESFASNLTRLSDRDLTRITKDKILFSKFMRLENDSDAVYSVVTYDRDEDEFNATKVTVSAYVGGKFKFDWQPMPDGTYDNKKDAVKLAKDTATKY